VLVRLKDCRNENLVAELETFEKSVSGAKGIQNVGWYWEYLEDILSENNAPQSVWSVFYDGV
jgi:hypothetical protein